MLRHMSHSVRGACLAARQATLPGGAAVRVLVWGPARTLRMMNRDSRQQFRFALLAIGWALVGLNLAVQSWAGAIILGIAMTWATWMYFKRRRNAG